MAYNLGAGIGALIVLAALGLSVFGIVDAARRPQAEWDQAGQNKPLWIVLLAVSVLFDFIFLIGLIISILYMVIARPKLGRVGTGSSGSDGWGSTPYRGPGGPSGPEPGGWGQTPGAYPGSSWAPTTPGSPPAPTPGSPSPVDPNAPVAGWYADPAGSGQKRYWDGRSWTNEVRP